MLKISKETKISEIMQENIATWLILKRYGMDCINCLAKNNETIEACAKVHDVELDKLIADLQRAMH